MIASVILSARNEYPAILFTVHAILEDLSNTLPMGEFEVILVDNLSDDRKERRGLGGTTDFLKARGMFHNGLLKTFYYPTASNVGARNFGVSKAKGKYIFFSDAHMFYAAGTFKRWIQTIDESGGIVHPAVAWIGSFPPQKGMQYSWKLGEEFKGCVDEKTEILAKDGWKKWNEVSNATEFATINTKTKRIEFQKPSGITIKEHDGDMYQFTGRSVDAFLTPYHRTPYLSQWHRRNKKKNWMEKPAEKISKSDFLPLATNGVIKSKSSYSDSFVELIGWVITEGSYDKTPKKERITITQYNEPNRSRIIKCAKEFGYSFHLNKRKDVCIAQRGSRKVFNILPEKKLTFEFINRLSRKQLEILYKTMIDGDGTRQKNNETFIQKNKGTIDAFQYLCILIGKQSKAWYRKTDETRFSKDGIFNVSVKKNEYASGFKIEKKYYKGKVWCPTVLNGSIFIRRNGKTMPSFQTWANYLVGNGDDWFHVAAMGHCSLGMLKSQFEEYGGYIENRCYGGGEMYLDTLWWMMGSCSVTEPRINAYHLSSERGYSYHHDDYIHNVFTCAYALGADDWMERTYINYLRKNKKEVLDALWQQAIQTSEKRKQFVAKNKKKSFNEVISERPWDALNDKKFGSHNSGLLVFHDTWLPLIKGTPAEAVYPGKHQLELEKFINEKLSAFVYRRSSLSSAGTPMPAE